MDFGDHEDFLQTVQSLFRDGTITRAQLFDELDGLLDTAVPDADAACSFYRTICKEVFDDIAEYPTEEARKRMKSTTRSVYMTAYLERLREHLQQMLKDHGINFRFDSVEEVIELFDLDHIFPRDLGGPDSLFNYGLLLRSLNRSLQNASPLEGRKELLYEGCVLGRAPAGILTASQQRLAATIVICAAMSPALSMILLPPSHSEATTSDQRRATVAPLLRHLLFWLPLASCAAAALSHKFHTPARISVQMSQIRCRMQTELLELLLFCSGLPGAGCSGRLAVYAAARLLAASGGAVAAARKRVNCVEARPGVV